MRRSSRTRASRSGGPAWLQPGPLWPWVPWAVTPGLGQGWAQRCWQAPPALFAQVTPEPSCPPGEEGAAPGGLRTALPVFPHPGAPCPVSRPPCSCSAPGPGAAAQWRWGCTSRCPPRLSLSRCRCEGGLSVQKRLLQRLVHRCAAVAVVGDGGPAPGKPKVAPRGGSGAAADGTPGSAASARPASSSVLFLRSTMFYFSAETFVQS